METVSRFPYIYNLFEPLTCSHSSPFSRLCRSPLLMAVAASSFLPLLSLDDGRCLGRRLLESCRALTSCAAAPPGARQMRVAIAPMRAAASFKEARVSAGEKKDERPIVVIDNYDSFTYNLCQYIGELGVDYEVYRNDELTVEDIRRKNPKGILISPGPGAPQESGISMQTVLELGPSIPLFGVCMGLQCIGEAFGGKIVRTPSGVRHGKSSLVYYDEKLGENLFDGLPNPFSACRYHSLVIEKETFPVDKLEITAWTEDGLIMAARHKKYMHIKGVQFHPESIITTDGKTIILNFIKFLDKFQEELCKKMKMKVSGIEVGC